MLILDGGIRESNPLSGPPNEVRKYYEEFPFLAEFADENLEEEFVYEDLEEFD